MNEVFDLLCTGARTRSIATTDMNDYSSRSHTVFQIVVDTTTYRHNAMEAVEATRSKCKLSLVDLAGSEKWRMHTSSSSTSGSAGSISQDRIKEMTSINKSLSALGNCVAALTQMPSR